PARPGHRGHPGAVPPGELPPVPGGDAEVPGLHVGGLDIVTRPALALRTKSLNDELRVADVSLRSAVLTDSLTGLANRRAAEKRLRSLTAPTPPSPEPNEPAATAARSCSVPAKELSRRRGSPRRCAWPARQTLGWSRRSTGR